MGDSRVSVCFLLTSNHGAYKTMSTFERVCKPVVGERRFYTTDDQVFGSLLERDIIRSNNVIDHNRSRLSEGSEDSRTRDVLYMGIGLFRTFWEPSLASLGGSAIWMPAPTSTQSKFVACVVPIADVL